MPSISPVNTPTQPPVTSTPSSGSDVTNNILKQGATGIPDKIGGLTNSLGSFTQEGAGSLKSQISNNPTYQQQAKVAITSGRQGNTSASTAGRSVSDGQGLISEQGVKFSQQSTNLEQTPRSIQNNFGQTQTNNGQSLSQSKSFESVSTSSKPSTGQNILVNNSGENVTKTSTSSTGIVADKPAYTSKEFTKSAVNTSISTPQQNNESGKTNRSNSGIVFTRPDFVINENAGKNSAFLTQLPTEQKLPQDNKLLQINDRVIVNPRAAILESVNSSKVKEKDDNNDKLGSMLSGSKAAAEKAAKEEKTDGAKFEAKTASEEKQEQQKNKEQSDKQQEEQKNKEQSDIKVANGSVINFKTAITPTTNFDDLGGSSSSSSPSASTVTTSSASSGAASSNMVTGSSASSSGGATSSNVTSSSASTVMAAVPAMPANNLVFNTFVSPQRLFDQVRAAESTIQYWQNEFAKNPKSVATQNAYNAVIRAMRALDDLFYEAGYDRLLPQFNSRLDEANELLKKIESKLGNAVIYKKSLESIKPEIEQLVKLELLPNLSLPIAPALGYGYDTELYLYAYVNEIEYNRAGVGWEDLNTGPKKMDTATFDAIYNPDSRRADHNGGTTFQQEALALQKQTEDNIEEYKRRLGKEPPLDEDHFVLPSAALQDKAAFRDEFGRKKVYIRGDANPVAKYKVHLAPLLPTPPPDPNNKVAEAQYNRDFALYNFAIGQLKETFSTLTKARDALSELFLSLQKDQSSSIKNF